VDKFGSPLFYADSQEWRNQSSAALTLMGVIEKEQK